MIVILTVPTSDVVILSVTEGAVEEPALSVAEGICFTLFLQTGA